MSSINIVKHHNFKNKFPNLDIINYLIENYEIKDKMNNQKITKEDLLNNNEILDQFIYEKGEQKKNKDEYIKILENILTED